jgi:hypothetical protein
MSLAPLPHITYQQRTRARGWIVAAVIAVATLPFADVLRAKFVSDDFFALALYQQTNVSPLRFVVDAILSNARVPTTFYRPLAFTTLWAETRIWGTLAWPFHLTNLLLHAGICLLSLLFVQRLARRGMDTVESFTSAPALPAFVALVLFAVFPRRVEAVAWIACRPDLLATLFAVAAALVYVRALDSASRWLSASAGLLWFASLLSKESAILMPFALWPIAPHAGRTRWRAFPPFVVAFVLYLLLRRSALGMWVGGYGVGTLRPSPVALLRAVRHAAYLLLPPIEAADHSPWLAAATGVVALAMLAAVVFRVRLGWRTPLVRVGAVWVAAAILPIAALPVSLASTLNDRLLYFPGIGMACLLTAAFAKLPARRLVLAGGTAAVLCGLWTMVFAHRWHVAGTLSHDLIQQLAVRVSTGTMANDDVVHLAAVPDSYGGAYMLRTAVPEALHVAGVRNGPRVTVLTRYFLETPDAAPIEAQLTDPAHLRLRGCRDKPALLIDAEPSLPILQRSGAVSADRYGRYADVEFSIPPRTVLLVATPRAWLDVLPQRTVSPCDMPRGATADSR